LIRQKPFSNKSNLICGQKNIFWLCKPSFSFKFLIEQEFTQYSMKPFLTHIYKILVKMNKYIQYWQKKSLINYLQKIADKGNCIYNLGICIMHIVFIVVDNQVDLSIKPQLVNRLHGLPINKKTRHYLSTTWHTLYGLYQIWFILGIFCCNRSLRKYLILKRAVKAWIEGGFYTATLITLL
jgi:hypothetical protein